MSLNVSVLQGRLTSDPELKTTNNGVSVTSFSIAVDRKYQPKGEEKVTDFIDIVAWRNNAEFITKYFKKGSMIGIEGEIQTRTYEDKNGNKRKAVEVVVSNVSFCGSKSESPSNTAADPLPEFQNRLNDFEDLGEVNNEDLPF